MVEVMPHGSRSLACRRKLACSSGFSKAPIGGSGDSGVGGSDKQQPATLRERRLGSMRRHATAIIVWSLFSAGLASVECCVRRHAKTTRHSRIAVHTDACARLYSKFAEAKHKGPLGSKDPVLSSAAAGDGAASQR
ncbi:hypothetical protein F4802DRAFT_593931 [Xylaria palmicola]|nr:hypothetical protein F4802DRAFT_593931 [Xylaria palmicola]